MGLQKKFSFKFLLFSILPLLFSSCTSNTLPTTNESFQKKYGKEVDKIKVERTPSKQMQKDLTTPQSFGQYESEVVADPSLPNSEYYAYVDVSKFGEKFPQRYLPDGEAYEQNRGKNPSNSLPPDVFEVAYNVELYPAFRRVGAEFDGINIPKSDIYGVKTEISEKPYLLVGSNSLQKNLDHIETTRTAEDVEFSEILMKEQKQLRRKEKMIKIFGHDSIELASLEKSGKENSTTEAIEKKSRSDKLKQASDLAKKPPVQPRVSAFNRTILK
jgi:hypothetical protein